MKILYYDCFSGISGDMNLGAMLDLGVKEAYLRNELEKLHIHNEYELEVKRDERKGITGTRVNIKLLNQDINHHSYGDLHHHHHHDRNFSAIEDLIKKSDLSPTVKELSLKIFMEMAKAEAKIHGKAIHEVHFHEVGATDSIIDIVGAAICFDALNVDKVIFSHLAVGGGFVHCAHGKFPVPAPATTEILMGIPIITGGVEKELTTPTGAAIAKVLADEFTSEKHFSITKIGYGIGHRDNAIPNVLRVFLAEVEDKDQELAKMIECNIDDMNPEAYEYVMEKLFKKGAMDVYMAPIIMKKNRPSIKFSVLCSQGLAEAMTTIILKETTTLGVRSYDVEKTMLDRKMITVNTVYGDVPIKLGIYKDEVIKFKPEYEECKKIAVDHDIPLQQVLDRVKHAYVNNIPKE